MLYVQSLAVIRHPTSDNDGPAHEGDPGFLLMSS